MPPPRMHRYSNSIVAMVCHDTILGMQKAHELLKLAGTDAIPTGPFLYLNADLQAAAVNGVAQVRLGTTSPRDLHKIWVEFLTDRGWQPGPKDEEAKTHPNLVAWEELAPEQRDKDRVFLGVVLNMTLDVEAV